MKQHSFNNRESFGDSLSKVFGISLVVLAVMFVLCGFWRIICPKAQKTVVRGTGGYWDKGMFRQPFWIPKTEETIIVEVCKS